MITQTYDINLIPSSLVTLVRCSQYDTDLRTLVFNLYDDETLFDATGYTVRLGGTKPDKTGFLYDMTVNGSQVSLVITEQMTAVAGPTVCEITVYDSNDGRVSTVNFILQVERSALAGTEISETEIPLLQEAIDASQTVISLSETFGSPLVAQTAAEMTLTNRVYVYTGSESGYTAGNWYYYNGSTWVSGGVYQSAAVAVDSALSTTSQNPVQNKVITEEITDLKVAIEVESTLLPTIAPYNNAGAGTLSGDTLTIASGVVATGASRIGRAITFRDEAFIGRKFIFKPHFSVTGDKSIFVKTVTKQSNNDLAFNVVNDDVENLEIILDFTNATLASVSTNYFYVIVNGYNRAPSQTTTLTYTGYDLYEYIGETVAELSNTIGKVDTETNLIAERLNGVEISETLPTFVSNLPTGVTVDSTTNTATATQNVNAQFYIGYRFVSAVFDTDELLTVDFDVTTTGNTAWTPYIYPTTYDKFSVIRSEIKDGIAHFVLRITDSTLNFLVLAVQTSMFYANDTITVSNVSSVNQSVKQYIDSKMLSYYSGKELTCFGDSYTMQAKWQPTVCSELGMNPFTDAWGQSGGTLTSIYTQIDTINTDADVVTVWIGTNDYTNNRAVGSLDDTVDTQVGGYPTFAGALNYVCDWLANNMAGKTVVFITPTFRHDSADDTFETNNGKNADGYIKNNAGYVLADYADIMTAVANKWGYPCLDLFHNSGINEYTYASYYVSDRLHPSDAGAKMLGHKIAMFILQQ